MQRTNLLFIIFDGNQQAEGLRQQASGFRRPQPVTSNQQPATMNIEAIREYCLSKPGATEDFPFDEETLVIRVMNRIFAILPLERGNCVNLKCEPVKVIELREHYQAVEPAYHMNKQHWNTVYGDRDAKPREIMEWIDHSYELIVEALPRKIKEQLAGISKQ